MQLLHSSIDAFYYCASAAFPYLSLNAEKKEAEKMAYYNEITQRNPISVRILNAAAAMLSRAADRHAKKRVYNTTYSELSALTGRELADLGIHPTEIKRISWEAAYGATPR